MMQYVRDLRNTMIEHNYMLAIRDEFESLMMKSLFSLTEKKLENEQLEVYIKHRVFGAIVECVQNICKGENNELINKNAILLLRRMTDCFIVNSGNLIHEKRMKEYTAFFEKWEMHDLSHLKKEAAQLKMSVKTLDQRSRDEMSLMDLMIKSKKNFNYEFRRISEGWYFFYLELRIDIENI